MWNNDDDDYDDDDDDGWRWCRNFRAPAKNHCICTCGIADESHEYVGAGAKRNHHFRSQPIHHQIGWKYFWFSNFSLTGAVVCYTAINISPKYFYSIKTFETDKQYAYCMRHTAYTGIRSYTEWFIWTISRNTSAQLLPLVWNTWIFRLPQQQARMRISTLHVVCACGIASLNRYLAIHTQSMHVATQTHCVCVHARLMFAQWRMRPTNISC